MKFPVIVHNLKNYDSHFILKTIANRQDLETLDFRCIPLNKQKFLSFEVKCFKFIDSYCFLSESLEKLSENLDFN